MKVVRSILLSTLVCIVAGCSSNRIVIQKSQTMYHKYADYDSYEADSDAEIYSVYSDHNSITKRINTTECGDLDDWYLDGYRVGKSFTSQKSQMFYQRLSYCQLTSVNIPHSFKASWDRGFAVGNGD